MMRCRRPHPLLSVFPSVSLLILLFFVLGSNSQRSFKKPLADAVLEKARWCLRDKRGGPYASSNDDISCRYVEKLLPSELRDVKCEWNSRSHLIVTFQTSLSLNTTDPTDQVNCSKVREVSSQKSGEFSRIVVDPNIGVPELFRAPAAYMNWREWVLRTSPYKMVVNNALSPIPTLQNCTQLRSFTIRESYQFLVRNFTETLQQLPNSLEELLLENNGLKAFPEPTGIEFPSLKRFSLSKNRFSNTYDIFKVNLTKLAPNLEELDLSNNLIAFVTTKDFEQFPKLRILNMAHNDFVFDFQYGIFPANLRSLNISYNRAIRFFPSVKDKDYVTDLEVLDISYTPPRNNGSIFLSKYAPKLKRFYLSGFENIHIVNLTVDYLRMRVQSGNFPTIINSMIDSLDLSHGKINHFRNLGLNNTKVNHLDLAYNQISSWSNDTIFLTDKNRAWTQSLNLSYNNIKVMDRVMLRGLQPLQYIDLGANPFECNNCSVYILQGWLKYHASHVVNLNRSDAVLMCFSPSSMKNTPVTDTTFYDESCHDELSKIGVIPVFAIVALFIVAQVFVVYRYRMQILYMLHVYKLRVKGVPDNVVGCTHDVFVCYSSLDRAFVLDTLAPFLEEYAPEYYKAYIHERSFTLGSDIGTNIVEAIERSRHALLVVTEAFLKSEYCKKEFNMVTHRAFDGKPGYMVLLRYGPLRKDMIPRTLRMYMTTTTYLEWPDDPHEFERLEVRKRLVKALGRSLHQRDVDAANNQNTLESTQQENPASKGDLRLREKCTVSTIGRLMKSIHSRGDFKRLNDSNESVL